MSPEIVAAGVSAIGSLANSVIGSTSGSNLNSKNRRWQEHMSQLAYDRQRELTRDTYSLQKQGLLDAGFSPAALGGYTGGASQVSTGTPSPTSIPEYQPMDVSSSVNTYFSAQNMQKQNELLDAERQKKESEKQAIDKANGRYDELTDATLASMRSATAVSDATAQKVAAEVPLLNTQQEYLNWQASQAMLDYQKSEATYQSDIDRIKADNKCSQREAELRYDRAKDIIEAQLSLLRAQTYNARASGQAQLSNAFTNRLQYSLDKAISEYTNAYYKEAAGKLHSESVSEETFRHDRLRLLDNDATLRGLQGQMMGLDISNYDVDRAVDNTAKIVGAATGAIGAGVNVRNSNTSRMNAHTNQQNAETNWYNAETNRFYKRKR